MTLSPRAARWLIGLAFPVALITVWQLLADARVLSPVFFPAPCSISLSSAAAEWSGRSETLAAVIIAAFGMRVLDFIYSLLSDRAAVMQLIRDFLTRGASN